MQRYLTISLLLILAAPFMMKVSQVADYILRYEYYKNVLCENQDRPELNCNGKCVLAEKFQNAQTPEQPEVPGLLEYEIAPFVQDGNDNDIEFNSSIEKIQLFTDPASRLVKRVLQVPSPPPKA
jgi:hypothetical protein